MRIGKYAAENGPARVFSAFLKGYGKKITARRLKSECLLKLNARIKKRKGEDIDIVPQVLVLPKMSQERPLLLGNELDRSVQSFVEKLVGWAA